MPICDPARSAVPKNSKLTNVHLKAQKRRRIAEQLALIERQKKWHWFTRHTAAAVAANQLKDCQLWRGKIVKRLKLCPHSLLPSVVDVYQGATWGVGENTQETRQLDGINLRPCKWQNQFKLCANRTESGCSQRAAKQFTHVKKKFSSHTGVLRTALLCSANVMWQLNCPLMKCTQCCYCCTLNKKTEIGFTAMPLHHRIYYRLTERQLCQHPTKGRTKKSESKQLSLHFLVAVSGRQPLHLCTNAFVGCFFCV